MLLLKYSSFFLYLVALASIRSIYGQSDEPGALWKDKIIPYTIETSLAIHKSTIEAAMNEISQYTCLKFVPRTGQSNYLNIQSSSSCEIVVGSVYGGTPLKLSNQCVCKGIIMHGLYHAIGIARPGDTGPGHVSEFPCVRLDYSINDPQLCSKSTLNKSEIDIINKTYSC